MAITGADTATRITWTTGITSTTKGTARSTAESPVVTADAAKTVDAVEAAGQPVLRPIPVWFFAFEGLMGASYDVFKSAPYGWVVLGAAAVVNIVLARTVMRGRLRMVKAMLKGRRTRKIAVGLIALRVGAHVTLGAVGVEATSQAAHIGLAVAMCATTVGLLAFDQRVMLRALGGGRAA